MNATMILSQTASVGRVACFPAKREGGGARLAPRAIVRRSSTANPTQLTRPIGVKVVSELSDKATSTIGRRTTLAASLGLLSLSQFSHIGVLPAKAEGWVTLCELCRLFSVLKEFSMH